MSAPQAAYTRPAWCEPWCTQLHSAAAGVAELCVRLEEAGEDSFVEVVAHVLHDFNRATSTRDVSVRVGMEAISIPTASATALGVALVQAAALHTATASAVTR